jgi:hypothetical protein
MTVARGSMLTGEDKEEIKRLVGKMIAECVPLPSAEQKRGDPDQIAQVRDLLSDEGFAKAMFMNPATGESRVLKAFLGSDAIVDVTARAIEVFGTREKALRWLKTPVRSLGDRTPISLLNSPDGITRVQDTLGQAKHGVW